LSLQRGAGSGGDRFGTVPFVVAAGLAADKAFEAVGMKQTNT